MEFENDLSCMTVAVGAKASRTGRVLIGHNEDDGGRNVHHCAYVPAADWPEGTVLPTEEGMAAIPQVAHTYGYYWSQVRDGKGGMQGADTFYNDCGVCIVSNNGSGSREKTEAFVHEGGLVHNLRRILAERASTAREGLGILIDMVKTYGYAHTGRVYTIADSKEAFTIQLVRGSHYIGARVPDDAIMVMPNHYTFHTLHDAPEMFYSEDLITYAVEQGWYTPAVPGCYDDFDFALAYQDPEKYRRPVNNLRQKYGTMIMLGRFYDPEEDNYPYAVKAEKQVGLDEIFDFLETHYEGSEDDKRIGYCTCPHGTGVRRICDNTTIEASVYTLSDDPAETTLWQAWGHPCQLPFVPLHPLKGLPEALCPMQDAAKERAEHFLPKPGVLDHRNDVWQELRDFEHMLDLSDAKINKEWKRRKVALQTEFRSSPDTGDGSKCIDKAIAAVRVFAEKLNRVSVCAESTLSLATPCTEYRVEFSCANAPAEASLVFGPGGGAIPTDYAKAVCGSLETLGAGRYAVKFDMTAPCAFLIYPGKFEFFLGGTDTDGKQFAGMTVLTVND